MKIEWKPEYEIGIKVIDEQHQELIAISNRLLTIAVSASKKENLEEMNQVITQLKEYTVYHFQYEEEILDTYGYSNKQEHKKVHRAFVKRIDDFEKAIEKGLERKLMIDMLNFLTGWVASHIMSEDQKYRCEFMRNGKEEPFIDSK